MGTIVNSTLYVDSEMSTIIIELKPIYMIGGHVKMADECKMNKVGATKLSTPCTVDCVPSNREIFCMVIVQIQQYYNVLMPIV